MHVCWSGLLRATRPYGAQLDSVSSVVFAAGEDEDLAAQMTSHMNGDVSGTTEAISAQPLTRTNLAQT